MGKIIKFAGTRAFKITIICLAVFGALFMIIGGVLSASSSTSTPTFMQVNVSNHQQNGAIMVVDVYQRTTNIQVNTWSGFNFNTTAMPIHFEIRSGAEFISITPSIRTGGVALLTLRDNYRGIPYFHREGDPSDRIVINVRVGNTPLIQVLHIRINLPSNQVHLTTQLERFNGANWVPINAIDHTLTTIPGQTSHPTTIRDQFLSRPQDFRVNATLNVFGTDIYSTAGSMVQFNAFRIFELYDFDSSDIEIRWLQELGQGRPAIVMPHQRPYLLTFTNTYRFEIQIDFLGTTYRDIFEFRIVV